MPKTLDQRKAEFKAEKNARKAAEKALKLLEQGKRDEARTYFLRAEGFLHEAGKAQEWENRKREAPLPDDRPSRLKRRTSKRPSRSSP